MAIVAIEVFGELFHAPAGSRKAVERSDGLLLRGIGEESPHRSFYEIRVVAGVITSKLQVREIEMLVVCLQICPRVSVQVL